MRAVRKIKPGPGHIALCDIPEPDIEHPDDIKIAVQRGGLCGTDLHIRHGGYGFHPPVTLCHELSGEVVKVGTNVTRIKTGDRVTVLPTANEACGHCRYCRASEFFFCPQRKSVGSRRDGGFAEYCVIPQNLAFPLPESVSYDTAALVEPLACCIKAVLFSTKIVPGDWVLVSGPGPIGLMCADLARLAGGRVIVCGTDRDTHRLAIAKSAEHTLDVTRENISEFVRSITSDGADIVIECAGAAASIDQCLDAVRPLGTFTQVALLEHPVEVNWGKIIYKQLSVNSSIAQNWPSWQRALEMVIAKTIDPSAYISHRLPLENWEQAFDGAERQEGLKYVLYP